MVSYTKKLEQALDASNKRNKDLEAKCRELKYKNRVLQEELDFAKDVVLKNVRVPAGPCSK